MLKKSTLLGCSFLFALSFTGRAQNTLIMQPNADKGIDAMVLNRLDMINGNFGTDISLFVDGWTGDQQGSEHNDGRSLIKFGELDALKTQKAEVTSAKLVLYSTAVRRFSSAGNNPGKLFLITKEWSESTVTWNTQPTYDANSFVATPVIAQLFDSVVIDVSPLVQKIVNTTAPNHGFLYKLDSEDPYRSIEFASSDYTADAKRTPKLIVEYKLPVEPNPEGELILQPDPSEGYDAMVLNRTDMINGNFGADISLFVDGWSGNQQGSPDNDGRSFIKFVRLDELKKQKAVVTNAQLVMYSTAVRRFSDSGDNRGKLFNVNKEWSESTITWNNQPTYDPAPFVVTPLIDQYFDSVVIDVSSLVKRIVDGVVPNYGFLYKLDDEDPYNSIEFASSDYILDAKRRPKLVVKYEPSVTTYLSGSPLQAGNVHIFPNPATSELFFRHPEQIESFAVYSSNGLEVLKGDKGQIRLDLSTLDKGMYMIRISTQTETSSQKFFKQ